MYLYVLGFTNHPSLLKVGVSKSPLDRIATLEKHHGKCVSSVFYNMGETYKQSEKLLHVLLKESNILTYGDGGTEFFKKESVHSVVEKVVSLCNGQREEITKVIKTSKAGRKICHYSKVHNRSIIAAGRVELQLQAEQLQQQAEQLQQQVEQLKQERAKAEEREEWLKQLLQANQQTIAVLLENQG